mgnify:CR=1 FL=1
MPLKPGLSITHIGPCTQVNVVGIARVSIQKPRSQKPRSDIRLKVTRDLMIGPSRRRVLSQDFL